MCGPEQQRWLRAHLRELKGYVPGAQPGPQAIKLNTNENPFPPSPAVMSALAEITPRSLQRYPDPMANGFRQAAARLHRLEPDQIIATNGGDELLRLAVTSFVDPGHAIGVITPGYGVYSVLSAIHQARLSPVPLGPDWDLPVDTAARWNADGAQLALISNPHAPSGALFSLQAIERLAETFEGVLLIDEAYADFIDPELDHDATQLVARHPKVLLLRTLSKGYALAGLRLAYGLGQAALLAPMLQKTKDAYNVDAIAQTLGKAALNDSAYAKSTWVKIRRERVRLSRDLEELGLEVAPSQTNFVLASLPPPSRWGSARNLHMELHDTNIHVRWFDEERLRDRLRISVGTHAENTAFVDTLRILQQQARPHLRRPAHRSTGTAIR